MFDVTFRAIESSSSKCKSFEKIIHKHKTSNLHLQNSSVSSRFAHFGVGDITVVEVQKGMSSIYILFKYSIGL